MCLTGWDPYYKALTAMKGRWCECAALTAIQFLVVFVFDHSFGLVFSIIGFLRYFFLVPVTVMITMGFTNFYFKIAKNQEEHLTDLLFVVQRIRNFSLFLILAFLAPILIVMGLICLIIPGVYLLQVCIMSVMMAAEDGSLGIIELFTKSNSLVSRNFNYFLCMSLEITIFQAAMSIISLGIGTLWIIPYVHVVVCFYYLGAKEKWYQGTPEIEE